MNVVSPIVIRIGSADASARFPGIRVIRLPVRALLFETAGVTLGANPAIIYVVSTKYPFVQSLNFTLLFCYQ